MLKQAMKKEVDALRRLRHPRLVRFIGATLQPPLLLVVTEPLGGLWSSQGSRNGLKRCDSKPGRSTETWGKPWKMMENDGKPMENLPGVHVRRLFARPALREEGASLGTKAAVAHLLPHCGGPGVPSFPARGASGSATWLSFQAPCGPKTL